MRVKVSLFLAGLSLVAFSFFSPRLSLSEEKALKGGVYRRPLEFNPKTLDPALSTDMYAVTLIQQLFDGLVQFDKDLNIVPAIARSWKVSPDGLTYTFYLREGVRFHHGREVHAGDFVYSFARICDPEIKSSSANFFSKILGAREFAEKKAREIKGLVVQNKYVLQIFLSEPYAPFMAMLAMKGAKVVPKEEVEKKAGDFGKFPTGTGPFKLLSVKEGQEIILEANKDYFEGRPYLDRIAFKVFHGAPREEILRRFREGGLEESFIPFGEFEDLARSKQYPLLQKPILALRFYGLNTQTEPLKHEKVRKAVQQGTPKALIDRMVLKGMARVTDRIIPFGMPGYTPGKVNLGYDPERARELLKESGYTEGHGLPPIEFWSAARSDLAVSELEMVKKHLAQAGISLRIHYETQWPKFQEILSSRKAPMFMYAWYADFPDPDNFLGTLFHSKSEYNFTAYSNPEVDRLLDEARAERDYLKRMEAYRRIEEIILEDAPIVPMVNPLFQMVYQPYVRGVEVSALGGPYIPMKKIWLTKK